MGPYLHILGNMYSTFSFFFLFFRKNEKKIQYRLALRMMPRTALPKHLFKKMEGGTPFGLNVKIILKLTWRVC
jgi:hypothetical protein